MCSKAKSSVWPCAHIPFCEECSSQLLAKDARCPLCGVSIVDVIKLDMAFFFALVELNGVVLVTE